VSETVSPHPPAPRIEQEVALAERLEAEFAPAALTLTPTREGPGTLALTASGLGVLGIGAAGLGAVHLVAGAFAASVLLGWGSVAVAATGFGLLGAGIWRELRGLWGLRHVDHLRADLASGDIHRMRNAALDWLAELSAEHQALAPAIQAADRPESIRALLRAGPAHVLRGRTDALSTTASIQILAAIAAIPSPALDGLLVGWRGVRLVRQVAELHGLRPGALATLALLRRTVLSAALVTATDIATNTAVHALFSNRLLGQVAGDAASALVAARRMRLLARAASLACSPLEGGTTP
jgi:putative membrane protein